MNHPHLSSECELRIENNEVTCDNVPRLRRPRLMDDGETLEFTCQMQAHELSIADIPDTALVTVTRRLFERDKEHKADERERLREEVEARGLYVPDAPRDTTWYVIELTEAETRTLEAGPYPEAYQMSQVPDHFLDDDAEGFSARDDDAMRVMLLSGWALMELDEAYDTRATNLEASQYERDLF